MSIFPGSPALAEDAALAMGIPAPEHVEPHLQRVTLAARVLPAARLVIVMVSGTAKAQLMSDILDGDVDMARLPAQAALLPQTVWMLDQAAAARLATEPPGS